MHWRMTVIIDLRNSFLGNWETVFVFFFVVWVMLKRTRVGQGHLPWLKHQVEHPGWLGVDEGGSATGSGDASFEI